MLMMEEEVPPGAPTVDSAGPALPALLMKIILCLCTACKHHLDLICMLSCSALHLIKLLPDRVPSSCQLGRYIGANADDGGGRAAWRADSGQCWTIIASSTDKDDVVLVYRLQAPY